MCVVALRKESVDRKLYLTKYHFSGVTSLSARRAWIEKWLFVWIAKRALVALRKESVDRKLTWHCMSEDVSVALRKESVDRKRPAIDVFLAVWAVALRKESVDRKLLSRLNLQH